jgi:hypothetical protein
MTGLLIYFFSGGFCFRSQFVCVTNDIYGQSSKDDAYEIETEMM